MPTILILTFIMSNVFYKYYLIPYFDQYTKWESCISPGCISTSRVLI